MSVVAITGKAALSTLAGVATPERMQAARENRELQAAYVTDLVGAYRSIDTLALQVEGAKAKHGAYIYRNLEELAVKGRVKIGDQSVALGDAVAEALGKVSSNEGVKKLSSGSATRYKYISRVYFDAGITDEDPDWADITNYYVSDSRLTEVLKYRDRDSKPANLTELVREAVARIRAPKPDPKVIESTATVEGESQDPENGAEVGGSMDESGATGADTTDNREAQPNGDGAVLTDGGKAWEAILAALAALPTPDAEDIAAAFQAREILLAYVASATDADRAEGKRIFEKLSK